MGRVYGQLSTVRAPELSASAAIKAAMELGGVQADQVGTGGSWAAFCPPDRPSAAASGALRRGSTALAPKATTVKQNVAAPGCKGRDYGHMNAIRRARSISASRAGMESMFQRHPYLLPKAQRRDAEWATAVLISMNA